MKKIKLKRFIAIDPAHCSVAASATIGEFYDKGIDYNLVKGISYKKICKTIAKNEEGLDSSQICMLLNHIGFKKVTLITSDLAMVDYRWKDYGKRKMKGVLKEACSTQKDKIARGLVKDLYKWYSLDGFDNNIKVDYNFGKHIRKQLSKGKPLLLSFNWTMFFRFTKEKVNGDEDAVNGDYQHHSVAINGYDSKGVWIVDSHIGRYTYKRKKYSKGYYKMPWENLMTSMGEGDIIIPDDYCKE